MSTGNLCPDLEVLAAQAKEELSDEDSTALDQHFQSCRACLDRFVELGRRSLVGDIPGYHIVKEMGRGRFGVVYKAWQLADRPKLVALKVLSVPGSMEKNRFGREIEVLRRIDSPGIVKCLGSGSSGDASYYVMDFVEGQHLDEYLANPEFTLTEKLEVFERVCRAVADAHELGVIHRDLKPKNILIDAKGNPHVLDFGICTVDESSWSSWERMTITQPGDVMGTLKYMSPEQAWGGVAGDITLRSDLWALGVMLHEIVTGGEYPYDLGSTREKPAHEALLERIRKELPRCPKLEGVWRGGDLETLVQRCLTWEPERRIASATALAEDLAALRQDGKIRTKPHWLPYRVKRLAVGAATRSRWMFSISFVALTMTVIYLTTFLPGVGWHVSGQEYHGSGDVAAGAMPQRSARDAILVVGVGDETVPLVVQFASDTGIGSVSEDPKSWRAVHGRFMSRLASVAPKAVVWDYYFQSEQPADGEFVEGVRALEAVGVPVILAVDRYAKDGTPKLSPRIMDMLGSQLRQGAISARDMVKRPGEFFIAVKPSEGVVVPSVALTTLASVLHPEAQAEPEWHGRERWIWLHYKIAPGAYLRQRDRVDVTKVFKAGNENESVGEQELQACTAFSLDTPEAWEERTVPYENLLRATDAELKELVEGKIVLFGDLRKPQPGFQADRHRVKYSTGIVPDVPGCYLLADSVAGLLDRRYLKAANPLALNVYVVLLAVAAVGCLLPIRIAAYKKLERRATRRFLAMVLGLSLSVCWLLLVASSDRQVVYASMGTLALLLPMAGSFWVEFARDRHRLLDDRRRAVVSLVLSDGTVTLGPTQPKSHRAT